MTYSEAKALVAPFLDVDARRRGTEVLIEATTQAAINDLKFYVDRYTDGKDRYANASDVTRLDMHAVEAISEFVKSRIARNIRNDIQLSREHMGEYRRLRTRCFIANATSNTKHYMFPCGEPLIIDVPLLVNGSPAPIEGWKIWFTMKHSTLQSDRHALAQLELGQGITPNGLNGWLISLLGGYTKLAPPGEYLYEIEAENPLGDPYVLENGNITLEAEINRIA